VAFFTDTCGKTANADAVAAHDGILQRAVLVEILHVHTLGVLITQLEDVADLDAVADAQRMLAADGTDAAGNRACDVHIFYLAEVALDIEAGVDYDIRKAEEYKNYNVQKDSTLANNEMDNRKVNEYSVFAQAGYSSGAFSILAGTRYSNNELYGHNISSRTTLVYSLDEINSFKLIWGQSFRAPSLFELYFATSSKTVFGNTALDPEKSTAIEFAYLTSFDRFFVQALVYYSTYENKIFRVRRNPASTTDKSTIYVNGSSFEAKGLELEIKYHNENILDFFANYTYTKGNSGDEVNNDGHFNFKYVPQHILSFGTIKKIQSFSASLLMNYLSETSGPKTEISGFITADLGIGYDQKAGGISLSHRLSVKNIFDETILFPEFSRRNLNSVPSGYGRRVMYEVQIQL